MTVDEYRAQVVEKIKARRDTLSLNQILTDAKDVLDSSNLSQSTKSEFWDDLQSDLTRIKNSPLQIVEKQGAQSLSEVIAAAQAIIAQHQTRSPTAR